MKHDLSRYMNISKKLDDTSVNCMSALRKHPLRGSVISPRIK